MPRKRSDEIKRLFNENFEKWLVKSRYIDEQEALEEGKSYTLAEDKNFWIPKQDEEKLNTEIQAGIEYRRNNNIPFILPVEDKKIEILQQELAARIELFRRAISYVSRYYGNAFWDSMFVLYEAAVKFDPDQIEGGHFLYYLRKSLKIAKLNEHTDRDNNKLDAKERKLIQAARAYREHNNRDFDFNLNDEELRGVFLLMKYAEENRIKYYSQALEQEGFRSYCDGNKVKVTETEIKEISNALTGIYAKENPVSLNSPIDDQDETELGNFIPDDTDIIEQALTEIELIISEKFWTRFYLFCMEKGDKDIKGQTIVLDKSTKGPLKPQEFVLYEKAIRNVADFCEHIKQQCLKKLLKNVTANLEEEKNLFETGLCILRCDSRYKGACANNSVKSQVAAEMQSLTAYASVWRKRYNETIRIAGKRWIEIKDKNAPESITYASVHPMGLCSYNEDRFTDPVFSKSVLYRALEHLEQELKNDEEENHSSIKIADGEIIAYQYESPGLALFIPTVKMVEGWTDEERIMHPNPLETKTYDALRKNNRGEYACRYWLMPENGVSVPPYVNENGEIRNTLEERDVSIAPQKSMFVRVCIRIKNSP